MGNVSEVVERFREVARACEGDVFWTPRSTPMEAMRRVAQQAEELGIDQWDVYAERGAVARLEREVAELLGKSAAAMFPSGVMAQQAVPAQPKDFHGPRVSGGTSEYLDGTDGRRVGRKV